MCMSAHIYVLNHFNRGLETENVLQRLCYFFHLLDQTRYHVFLLVFLLSHIEQWWMNQGRCKEKESVNWKEKGAAAENAPGQWQEFVCKSSKKGNRPLIFTSSLLFNLPSILVLLFSPRCSCLRKKIWHHLSLNMSTFFSHLLTRFPQYNFIKKFAFNFNIVTVVYFNHLQTYRL